MFLVDFPLIPQLQRFIYSIRLEFGKKNVVKYTLNVQRYDQNVAKID
jgi:hypothetical protein